MHTVKIETPEDAMTLLREQVTKNGFDYQYTEPLSNKECRYIEPDEDGGYQPGCIVGHVLLQLGYEPSFADEPEDGAWDSNIEGTAASGLIDSGVIEAPEIVGAILVAAQAAQDQGQNWGQALSAAQLVHQGYKLGQKASS